MDGDQDTLLLFLLLFILFLFFCVWTYIKKDHLLPTPFPREDLQEVQIVQLEDTQFQIAWILLLLLIFCSLFASMFRIQLPT